MSAPETNLEKQKSRHRGVLTLLAAVVVFAGIVFFLNLREATDEDAGFDVDGAPVVESGTDG